MVCGETYWGAMPNKRAVVRRDITPRKKVTFSRVRTTFVDCHATASVVIRAESYMNARTPVKHPSSWIGGWRQETHLELELLHLPLQILRQLLPMLPQCLLSAYPLERLLRSHP